MASLRRIFSRINPGTQALKALFYTFIAALCFSLSGVVVRHEAYMDLSLIATYSFIGTLVGILPFVVYHSQPLLGPKNSRILMLGRCICSTLHITCAMGCFKYLPIAKAMVIVSSVPAFVSIIARVLLKEPCGKTDFMASFIAFVGVVVSVDPKKLVSGEDVTSYVGIVFGCCSVLCCCLVCCITRKIKDVHHTVLTLYHSIFGTIVAVIVTIARHEFAPIHCGLQTASPIGVAFFAFALQIFFVLALQAYNAGPVMVVECAFEVLMGILWHVVIFGEQIDEFTIIGAILMTCAVILVDVHK